MGTETELKLSLAASDIPALLKHPLLAAVPKRQKLHNTYFDTPGSSPDQRTGCCSRATHPQENASDS